MKRHLLLAAAVGTLALAAPAAFAGDRHHNHGWNRGHHQKHHGWQKHNHRPVVVKQKVVYRTVHQPAYGYRPFHNPPRPLAYYPAPRHQGLTLAFNF